MTAVTVMPVVSAIGRIFIPKTEVKNVGGSWTPNGQQVSTLERRCITNKYNSNHGEEHYGLALPGRLCCLLPRCDGFGNARLFLFEI